MKEEMTNDTGDQKEKETLSDNVQQEETQQEQPEAVAEETKEAEVPTAEEEATAEEETVKTETAEEAPAAEQAEETTEAEATAETNEAADEHEGDDDEDEEEEDDDAELPDYSEYTREQLVEVIEEISKLNTFKRTELILNEIEPLFKEFEDNARQAALDKFKADGGEEDDFEFRHDELYNRYDASLTLIRDRKSAFYKEREANKQRNLEKKEEILDKLRELIDDEATTSINPIKKLQEEWKAVGPVPNQHNRTLWANYNALLDRFYNNRHILFELKELDRKKNHKAKLELCEKAEALNALDNIKDAVIQLNELHEEYKHIGPVPREVQEELWQRFKAASDEIYKKRKSYLEGLKGELQENAVKKKALAEQLSTFTNFDSDRINDWNAKTKEILAIQKKWDAIGGVPRDQAKEINKAFWSTFKKFFSNKNDFFKKLESLRKDNLAKKEELVKQAIGLKDSEDWDTTAEKLKQLQRQWREIGPVPEKYRNSVYAKFKEACDAFFEHKRAEQNQAEASYEANLSKKEDIIHQISDAATKGEGSADELQGLLEQYNEIGFVPRNAIKPTETKLKDAVAAYVKALGLDESEAEVLMLKAEFGGDRSPGADKKLYKKESAIRRKIGELEDNISLWNNNLAFFANSKTADKLKEEFDVKIEKAREEISDLKKQLRVLRNL
ncbi:DUF349 domain-containing protein [Roseivirga pacifica]|uniref:DUF349 domain-containing protein n=2 Tax=Roseivirga pacifica TaxID=1267423 RepID=UPI0020955D4B|nr:DUF349 domain-containing protein [Roseivirga pacifica]